MQRFYALNPAARPRPCADAVVMASVGPFGFTAAAWSGLYTTMDEEEASNLYQDLLGV